MQLPHIFLPFRAVTNHGPKANPFPRRGYLVRYKTDRRLPLLCVPCRGNSLPNMPQLDAAHDQGRKVAPSMRHHRACLSR